MKNALKKAMMTSISEVIATMFFMPLEFLEEESFEYLISSSENIACRICFNGRFKGSFLLFIPENIIVSLTENFVGEAKVKITEDHLIGTIKEILNMISGSTFSNYDDQAVFNLDIPEIVDIKNISEASKKPDYEEIFIPIETVGGKLGVKLEFDQTILC